MSQHDTTVAQMTAQHALWAVKVKIVLAYLTLDFARLVVLKDHKTIIEGRSEEEVSCYLFSWVLVKILNNYPTPASL